MRPRLKNGSLLLAGCRCKSVLNNVAGGCISRILELLGNRHQALMAWCGVGG
jgi:hypothetical protein